ncbi:MAG: hypothetical protein AVDCRST_MAG33-1626 [uncultured Thermomicrobiales bacterium]|uniref:Uncharacterized protein n=1 Tax=uncultured Thermomicrobiales bacterium TaxID=1645740 RepID=A0A6J4UUL9_9BACT|nr:MAG: hypothetical protein AVDCRST_MAG33-1626 [uncultured Thermomicrobiales bacterium]
MARAGDPSGRLRVDDDGTGSTPIVTERGRAHRPAPSSCPLHQID